MREWLREARKASGYTAAQMSRELLISESYYSMIENGLRQVPMDITLAAKLEVILGIPLGEIAKKEDGLGS